MVKKWLIDANAEPAAAAAPLAAAAALTLLTAACGQLVVECDAHRVNVSVSATASDYGAY